MTILHCSIPQCIHRGPDSQCMRPEVELMFGVLFQLAGRGAEVFQRCAQIQTPSDMKNPPEKVPE